MEKRKKEAGFTLIELMIVIAVIGILAIVLVPKVGGVKNAAKTTGVDTNIRVVEAYIQGNITRWAQDTTITDAKIKGYLSTQFVTNTDISQNLANPFTNATGADKAITYDVANKAQGVLVITVPVDQTTLNSTGIKIDGYGADTSSVYQTATIKP